MNWTRLSMNTKQDSRMHFESIVFYSKTIQYVINFIIKNLQMIKAYSSVSIFRNRFTT